MAELKSGVYEHFKGGRYEVVGVARSSETEEEFVVYRSLEKETLWVRPLGMFTEHVERGGYKGPRFKYVGGVE